ncbi:MAG: hypothetical protein ABSG03_38070 [Bryobacteraceae bacterium]|jgi:hypothetical protein
MRPLQKKILIGTCCLTTAIAMLSVFSAAHGRLQTRVLPWVGGVLLGIGAFWILPEMAEQRGWALALIGVSAILLVLAVIDLYIYPICPFCAAGAHPGAASDSIVSGRRILAHGWPLLAAGCIHSFFDAGRLHSHGRPRVLTLPSLGAPLSTSFRSRSPSEFWPRV